MAILTVCYMVHETTVRLFNENKKMQPTIRRPGDDIAAGT